MLSRSVTEFSYRYDSSKAAQLFVGFGLTQGRAERDAVIRSLREAQYTVTDMTDNEMAKLHVRYMVGGHARGPARSSGRPNCRAPARICWGLTRPASAHCPSGLGG